MNDSDVDWDCVLKCDLGSDLDNDSGSDWDCDLDCDSDSVLECN